ncbi:hypothetical protein C8F04DRAFT_1095372 [Mycena alexandri]|uniref:Mid2 domain-containing protein n=1 Tax=Mycena alexandri TaxID=1745969 RepID=A0AAD6SDW5_9AGAR|nr:hypothetical protein C8F04DRAFT_1133868 [Mycena alexandri]KAJ7036376.1 hypothetical protein C8F04DRAFT_1095372 [Mycena alexandri]
MFYVFYVLALLCSSVLCLKVHRPGNGMVVANQLVTISWSRQTNDDPTSVLMVLENLIGGNLTPAATSNSSDTDRTTTSIAFPEAGTFRMWAVNPADPSQAYAQSGIFTVSTNNGKTNAGVPVNMNVNPGNDNTDDSAGSPPTLPHGSSSSTSSRRNTPVIIGAIIGSLVLLFLLLGVLFYVLRRRRQARTARHITFHKGRMVKALPPQVFAPAPESELESDIDEKDDDFEPRTARGTRYPQEERASTVPYPFARTV